MNSHGDLFTISALLMLFPFHLLKTGLCNYDEETRNLNIELSDIVNRSFSRFQWVKPMSFSLFVAICIKSIQYCMILFNFNSVVFLLLAKQCPKSKLHYIFIDKLRLIMVTTTKTKKKSVSNITTFFHWKQVHLIFK